MLSSNVRVREKRESERERERERGSGRGRGSTSYLNAFWSMVDSFMARIGDLLVDDVFNVGFVAFYIYILYFLCIFISYFFCIGFPGSYFFHTYFWPSYLFSYFFSYFWRRKRAVGKTPVSLPKDILSLCFPAASPHDDLAGPP